MRRLAIFVVLALCFGQMMADTHLHFDEHGEHDCTVCAIAELGFVSATDAADTSPSRWQVFYSSSTYSVTLHPRPYELEWSRAPPIS